jgi:hypothetical protein
MVYKRLNPKFINDVCGKIDNKSQTSFGERQTVKLSHYPMGERPVFASKTIQILILSHPASRNHTHQKKKSYIYL